MLLAQMVGRNEAGRYLGEVLHRLNQFVDQIVFTDDCSDDATPTVAALHGASVRLTDRPLFMSDEQALRSQAWAHLEEHAHVGDWILCIDCDELLYGVEELPSLLDQTMWDVLGITFFHMWNPGQFRIDKAWGPTRSHRLFRYHEGGEFKRKRLACGSEPTFVEELIRQGRVLWDTGLVMKHLGYLLDEDKVAKHFRYMEIDGGNFHSRAHLESILDPRPTLVDWTWRDGREPWPFNQ